MTTSDAALPIVVVLDATVWCSQNLLRSVRGKALIRHLRARHMRLAIPEVVEAEVKGYAKDKRQEAVDVIEKHARTLRGFSGMDVSVTLPSSDDLDRLVDKLSNDMNDVLIRVPMNMEHVRAALKKVVEKMPPNHKKKGGRDQEQFRDTLMWEAAVSLLGENKVHFVSDDGDFF